MKVIHNRKRHTNELYDVTLVCSPLEALVIFSTLDKALENEETHEKDRPLIKRMVADMRGDKE